jgi:HAD superfamily hydrolase (TIGR01490 family)
MSERPFAVFDIDGTLIRWQLYHAVANMLIKHGHFTPAAQATISETRMAWKRRDSDDAFKAYERELVKTYDEMLKSLTTEQFDFAAQEVFDEYKDQVYTYTRSLITDLKAKNYLLFAISGSQSGVVDKIAAYYGFDDYRASTYELDGNRFTGNKVVAAIDKHSGLEEMVTKHQASWQGSMAIGDTESDISMLNKVEQPIAFNPEKHLYDHARASGWKIVVERKNVIYELEARSGDYVLA